MSNPYPVSLTPITAPLPRVSTYTMQSGDTLQNVARHFYNNPLEARRIAALNGISNMNDVPAGTILKL